ncbi:hypothetical protein TNCV_161301 [Trichonephila clavipes]|nr:hypothetical protein TNCV_161301 [Trichonephila clavipes]
MTDKSSLSELIEKSVRGPGKENPLPYKTHCRVDGLVELFNIFFVEIFRSLQYHAETAQVYMYGVKGLCTEATEGKKSERKIVFIEKQSAATVTFPFIPLEIGTFNLKVVALTNEGSDVIVKRLQVILGSARYSGHPPNDTLNPLRIYQQVLAFTQDKLAILTLNCQRAHQTDFDDVIS